MISKLKSNNAVLIKLNVIPDTFPYCAWSKKLNQLKFMGACCCKQIYEPQYEYTDPGFPTTVNGHYIIYCHNEKMKYSNSMWI